mmetsp:Transcript_25545/g.30274  ORF Transcript_25545/g.30274 Transcript_25545/m.30274 type:complete len:207 (-) Transcript_25545:940-1560(-)
MLPSPKLSLPPQEGLPGEVSSLPYKIFASSLEVNSFITIDPLTRKSFEHNIIARKHFNCNGFSNSSAVGRGVFGSCALSPPMRLNNSTSLKMGQRKYFNSSNTSSSFIAGTTSSTTSFVIAIITSPPSAAAISAASAAASAKANALASAAALAFAAALRFFCALTATRPSFLTQFTASFAVTNFNKLSSFNLAHNSSLPQLGAVCK